MLKDHSAAPIVACSDVERSKAFYTQTLGLPLTGGDGDVFTLQTGASQLTVYRSEHAGTNQANAVVWDAGDEVEAIAAELRAKGVRLEEYPEMEMEIVDGVHRLGRFRGVWFKDPDGNILHLVRM
jgi:catechol 2,3-dioxygenase-like lactoylglutathione lyase family enzyme